MRYENPCRLILTQDPEYWRVVDAVARALSHICHHDLYNRPSFHRHSAPDWVSYGMHFGRPEDPKPTGAIGNKGEMMVVHNGRK